MHLGIRADSCRGGTRNGNAVSAVGIDGDDTSVDDEIAVDRHHPVTVGVVHGEVPIGNGKTIIGQSKPAADGSTAVAGKTTVLTYLERLNSVHVLYAQCVADGHTDVPHVADTVAHVAAELDVDALVEELCCVRTNGNLI